MKYIILEIDGPIIFGSHLEHSRVAGIMKQEVIGAGFVKFDTFNCTVSGKSVSLDLEAKEEDAEQLRRLLK